MKQQGLKASLIGALAIVPMIVAPAAWGLDESSEGKVLASTDHVTATRTADGWVHYEFASQFNGAVRTEHKGQKLDGECLFSGGRTVKNDGLISIEREIANNIQDCILVTETFSLTPEEFEDYEAGRHRGGDTREEEAVDGGRAGRVAAAARASKSAWHKTRYNDFVSLTLAESKTNVNWVYSGGCVTSSSNHTTNYFWMGATGWGVDSTSTTSGRVCAYATTTSNSTMSNSFFCAFNKTTVKFTPNRLRGNANGTHTPTWTTSKAGGCTDMITFESITGA